MNDGAESSIQMQSSSFYDKYFEFVGHNESPRLYHRWTAVSVISAMLGRQLYLPFGHDHIYPNFYILLVGDPGTRKGTAMKPGHRVLKAAGYKHFSPDRISPERFIYQMAHNNIFDEYEDLGISLETLSLDTPSEIYAMMGEFTDFIGSGKIDFITLLTNLWDNLPQYEHPKLHGKSISVFKPTVNILGGITPSGINTHIPIEIIAEGGLSRFILVGADGTGKRITFPDHIDDSVVTEFAKLLKQIKGEIHGAISITPEARAHLDRIYKEFIPLDDYRFAHYSTRRFTHLIKLCMVFAAMGLRMEINTEDCINANTLLHYTELKMPKALGEFGKAKNADVTNGIMGLLRKAVAPITQRELWKHVCRDLSKQSDLIDIMNSLKSAGRITVVATRDNRMGYLPLNIVLERWKPELLNDSFLTLEERA